MEAKKGLHITTKHFSVFCFLPLLWRCVNHKSQNNSSSDYQRMNPFQAECYRLSCTSSPALYTSPRVLRPHFRAEGPENWAARAVSGLRGAQRARDGPAGVSTSVHFLLTALPFGTCCTDREKSTNWMSLAVASEVGHLILTNICSFK